MINEQDIVPSQIHGIPMPEIPSITIPQISVDQGFVDLTPKTQRSSKFNDDTQSPSSRSGQAIGIIMDAMFQEIKKLEDKTKKQIESILDESKTNISSEIKKEIVDSVISELFSTDIFQDSVGDFGKSNNVDAVREIGQAPSQSESYRPIGANQDPTEFYIPIGKDRVATENYRPIGSSQENSESYTKIGSDRRDDDNYTSVAEDRRSSGNYRAIGESFKENQQQQIDEQALVDKSKMELSNNQLDWNNPMIVSEIILRQKKTGDRGGEWNGQVYFDGNLIEDYGLAANWPLNIGGEYIKVATDGSSVSFTNSVDNADFTEYFYFKVAVPVPSGGFIPSDSHAGGVHIWPELPPAIDGELDWYNVEARYVLARRDVSGLGPTERYNNEWYAMAPVPKADDENYELISNGPEDGDHGWADAIPLGSGSMNRANVSEDLARKILSKKPNSSAARSDKYENEWHPFFGVPSPSTAGGDGPLITSDGLYFWEPGWDGDIDVVTNVLVEDNRIVFKTKRIPFRYGMIRYDDPPQDTDDIIIPITDCT